MCYGRKQWGDENIAGNEVGTFQASAEKRGFPNMTTCPSQALQKSYILPPSTQRCDSASVRRASENPVHNVVLAYHIRAESTKQTHATPGEIATSYCIRFLLRLTLRDGRPSLPIGTANPSCYTRVSIRCNFASHLPVIIYSGNSDLLTCHGEPQSYEQLSQNYISHVVESVRVLL